MRARTLAILLALCAFRVSVAADPSPPDAGVTMGEIFPLDALTSKKEGQAYALIGHVSLEIEGGVSLRAQRAVVWLDPRVLPHLFEIVQSIQKGHLPVWAIWAVYAEGGRIPATFQAGGRTFRCSSLYYDLRTNKGTIADADLRLEVPHEDGTTTPLVLRAKAFRAIGPGEWRAKDVVFSSTAYYRPVVYLEARRVSISDEKVKKAQIQLLRVRAEGESKLEGPTEKELQPVLDALEAAAANPLSKRIVLSGVTLRLLGAPIFFVPRLVLPAHEDPPLRYEVEIGKRGQLGSGFRLGVGQDVFWEHARLAWTVGGAYYFNRGPLGDVETRLSALDGKLAGRTFAVYLHDHGQDFGQTPSTPNRYWTQSQYRWRFHPKWRLDGELALLSDATWLRVYDEKTYKEGKPQETLLYLRRRGDVSYFTATAKVQTIGFLDTLEELPRFTYSVPVLPLAFFGNSGDKEGPALQLALTSEAGYLRYRAGDAGGPGDFDTPRADAAPTLFLPFSVGPVRIVPFTTLELTAYGDTPTQGSLGRVAQTAGIRSNVQASRWYGDVLHVVDVDLEYEDLFWLSQSSSLLFPLDDIDRVTRYDMLGLRIRNRFRRLRPSGLDTVLDLETYAAWFPGGERPLGGAGEGLFELRMRWHPVEPLVVDARAGIEKLESPRLDTGSIETTLRPKRGWELGVGLRHLTGDSDILTSHGEFDVGTRWRLVGFSQFDLRHGDILDHGLLIQRLGQTMLVGVRVAYDPGGNNFSFSLNLDLVALLREKLRKQESIRDEIGWQ